MNALLFNAVHAPLEYTTLPNLQPDKEGIVVDLHAAALNHRDLYITQGQYAGIQAPCILGSDGAGEYKGKKVIINPSIDWGTNPNAQQKQFRVLGMPDNGTFATQIKIAKKQLHPMPEHLNWEQAAALPLAGLTAYRTLFTRCKLRKGEKVLISGVGGGVALMALQFAVAAGATVFVTSGTGEKIKQAEKLGAKGGVNYKQGGWDKDLKAMAGGFDVIIDSAAGDGFGQLAGLCNPGGRVGIYGGTLGKINNLSPQIIFWKQISILGSTMGTASNFKSMLQFVQTHEIVPIVDSTFTLKSGNQALELMEKGQQFGKVVLTCA
jgi:NADPH:quinone reductase-like Zn-dependent oxidoreductase